MTRKAKGPAFQMRSPHNTTFKMMGSTSPLYKPKGMTGLTDEERAEKRAKLREDIKRFGKGVEGSLKDVKHILVDDKTRKEMVEKGYETPKVRKEKYGTTSFDPAKGYGKTSETEQVETSSAEGPTTVSSAADDVVSPPATLTFDAGTSMTDAFKQATKGGAKLGDMITIGKKGEEGFWQGKYEFEGDYLPPHLREE